MDKTKKQITLRFKRTKLEEDIKMTEILIKHAEKNNDYETQIAAERKLSRQKAKLNIISTALAKIEKG